MHSNGQIRVNIKNTIIYFKISPGSQKKIVQRPNIHQTVVHNKHLPFIHIHIPPKLADSENRGLFENQKSRVSPRITRVRVPETPDDSRLNISSNGRYKTYNYGLDSI